MPRVLPRWLLMVVVAVGCAEPTEPPVPPVSFNHVCCASGILIPFADDGRWTELSVMPAGGTSDFTFFISMTHPLELPVPSDGGSVGSFPGSTLVQLVVQGCDTSINLCFTARTRRLSGDEVSGQIRFGAELNQAQEDFGDFLYDVFLVPVTPPDTLAVELTLARDSVGPVMAPIFDAVTQVAESLRPRRRAERTDTVRVHVRARYLPSGRRRWGRVSG